MTAHPSRLPLGLAPLIAEAKHRMWRRRSLVALGAMLAVVAAGLTFVFRSPGPGSGSPNPPSSSLRTGQLSISVPRGFDVYELRGGIYRAGTRPPVIGHVLTNFRPRHGGIQRVLGRWAAPHGAGPPASRVALKLELWNWVLGIAPPDNLHLPLTPSQPWFEEKLDHGAVGYRWGYLSFRGVDYQVMYWSGSDAPATDRSAIVRALESIRPAR